MHPSPPTHHAAYAPRLIQWSSPLRFSPCLQLGCTWIRCVPWPRRVPGRQAMSWHEILNTLDSNGREEPDVTNRPPSCPPSWPRDDASLLDELGTLAISMVCSPSFTCSGSSSQGRGLAQKRGCPLPLSRRSAQPASKTGRYPASGRRLHQQQTRPYDYATHTSGSIRL